MNISKSQSYNLSPDQYLKKFQRPHSVISSNGKQERYNPQIELLQSILKKYNQKPQSLQTKLQAIKQLQQILYRWLNIVYLDWKNNKQRQLEQLIKSSEKQKISKNFIDQQFKQYYQYMDISFQQLQLFGYGPKIFGSFSLSTNSHDGDIDIICVIPDILSRQQHFYCILTDELKKHPHITGAYPIPDAMVPLIKLTMYSIQMDLLVSRLPISLLKQNPGFFQGQINGSIGFVNDKELKCINGYRTSLYFKKNIKNYKNYQVVAKAIKMWAMNKGIYSQIYGYLGGTAISIMLAKICQLYPNYSPLQLLDRFFFIYSNWIWSMPVMIEECNIDQKTQGGMLIFTPLQPHVNAAHCVSRITCHLTRKQLKLASKVIQQINRKKKQWKDLFQPVDFFKTYGNFIELSIMGQKYQDFIVWKGAVQSKIRRFIKCLQNQIQNLQLIEIHPYPGHFISKHSQYKYCFKYYFGIKCESNPNLNDYCEIDLTVSIRQFLDYLEEYHDIDKVPKQLNIGISFVEKRQIQKEILEGLRIY